ncbi:MAG: hypothetical protein KGJ78_16260 [Alphaproteobacteria bacterium]|nr:hypothetical protein [Alphaproteobacteria bacterium]
MWWRLGVLWSVMAALLVVLFLPIQTHAVKLDMPANGAVTLQQVEMAAQRFSMAVETVLLLTILGLFVWLNFHIIRRYRKSG